MNADDNVAEIPGEAEGSILTTPMMVTPISLGMLAGTVESFSGRENVKLYFERLEQRAILDNWNETQMLHIVRYRLSGEAYKFYKAETNLQSNQVTYVELREKLIKKFTPRKLPGEALGKLMRAFQKHDESVSSYVTSIKSIANEIIEEDKAKVTAAELPGVIIKINELALSQFKVGMKRELSQMVGTLLMRETDLTLDKAEEIASFEELNQATNRNRPNRINIGAVDTTTRLCYRCGKSGHFAKFCNAQTTVFNCYNCGKPGHISKQCRLPSNKMQPNYDQRRDLPRRVSFQEGHSSDKVNNRDRRNFYYQQRDYQNEPRRNVNDNNYTGRQSPPQVTRSPQIPANNRYNETNSLNAYRPAVNTRTAGDSN